MNTNNYLPFDLETALKHPERVVTRDGRKVSQLTKFSLKEQDILVGAFTDIVYNWRIDGKEFHDQESYRDLVLLPEVKECWVNVYEYKDGTLNTGDGHKSKQDAIDKISDNPNNTYIKTIRITNEPE